MKTSFRAALALTLIAASGFAVARRAAGQPPQRLVITKIGGYATGLFNEGGAEIAAYDKTAKRLYFVSAVAARVEVLSLANPASPQKVASLDLTSLGTGVNSVSVHNGLVAVAIESSPKTAPGKVAFFDAAGNRLSVVTVGSLPDMLTFTPDGRYVLVANEGEPLDYCTPGLANDPEGSVSVIDVRGGAANLTQANVRTAGFVAWNETGAPDGIRIYGPGATVAQDLEPEYITVSADSRTAWVTLQENNALAKIDIETATVTELIPLGLKDHSQFRNALDASDRDGVARIVPWPVWGMYQPDAISSYSAGGQDYLVLANEGDAREYDCFAEAQRVSSLTLDPQKFPNAAALQAPSEIGRLQTTSAGTDEDGDGVADRILTYGARSFSIRDASGNLVYDSGNELELITASLFANDFNSNNDENGSFDSRSDDKGPEPEGVTVDYFWGRMYAFIALERIGGVMVYDVSDPRAPFFVQYINPRNFAGDAEAGTAGDLGPEGVLFIRRPDSPIQQALLVTANEVSGTVGIYSVRPRGADE